MLNLTAFGHKLMCKALPLTLTLAALFIPVFCAFGDDFSAGPFFDNFPLTLSPGERTEIMGPFYYHQQNGSEKTVAFPPFYSHDVIPDIDATEINALYPLFTYVKYGTQWRAQFVELISFSGGLDPDNLNRHRISFYPFYFQQRSPDTNSNYTAFFPFYGHLKGRIFRDKIFFVMFPAYSQTQKRDVINDNYLYPFFNVRHGDGMHGWQFWPFYGSEHKVVTTLTNNWGDVQTNGGHDQYFVLWPIHLRETGGIGTASPEQFRADLPFFSWYRSPARDSTSVLWPFFNWIDDREKKYHEKELPWPFIITAHGEGKTALRVFPFFQKAHNATFKDNFYLWPIYRYNSVYAPPLDRRRTRVLMFLFQDTYEKNTATGKDEQRLDLWPLFNYHRDLEGNSRLQILALLESFVPGSPGIERNWSPLWSVWRYEKNPTTDANSESFLWNFYRRDASPGQKKISFFFGLYQYQSNQNQGTKKVRLFFIPVINRQPVHSS
jgi:hypothetical protein